MKKIFAILLALVLTFAMSAVAFADTTATGGTGANGAIGSQPDADGIYTDTVSVDIGKLYQLANAGTSNPAETFKFEITAKTDGAPTINAVEIEYSANAATTEGLRKTATITLPAAKDFGKVGEYVYEITEKTPENATVGVEYSSAKLYLVVTVIEQSGLKRVAAIHVEKEDGTKIASGADAFTNTYKAASGLSITKNVTGTMGDKSAYFEVYVTVTNPTSGNAPASYTVTGASSEKNPQTITAGQQTTFYLKDNETITIKNVPYGVTYSVSEKDYTSAAEGGYDAAKYSVNNGEASTTAVTGQEVANATESVVITNNRTGDIDTGITMDSIPYVVLLALAVVGLAAVAMKKRYEA